MTGYRRKPCLCPSCPKAHPGLPRRPRLPPRLAVVRQAPLRRRLGRHWAAVAAAAPRLRAAVEEARLRRKAAAPAQAPSQAA